MKPDHRYKTLLNAARALTALIRRDRLNVPELAMLDTLRQAVRSFSSSQGARRWEWETELTCPVCNGQEIDVVVVYNVEDDDVQIVTIEDADGWDWWGYMPPKEQDAIERKCAEYHAERMEARKDAAKAGEL